MVRSLVLSLGSALLLCFLLGLLPDALSSLPS